MTNTNYISTYANMLNMFKALSPQIIKRVREAKSSQDERSVITINDIQSILEQLQDMLNNSLASSNTEITITINNHNQQQMQQPNLHENKKKQIVRLTESDLHRVVEESVKRVLRENDYHGIPWSDSDDEEGRNFDWQLYTSNPYGNFGMGNMNITDRNGELSMAAQSDVPSLKALGRNGATTTGKHFDALNKFTKRNWKDGRTRNGNFDLNGLLNRGIQQSYDSRKEKEKKERERKDSLNYNRMIKSADKRPLHHKGSLNREF